jgi:hypothetical protein
MFAARRLQVSGEVIWSAAALDAALLSRAKSGGYGRRTPDATASSATHFKKPLHEFNDL